MKKNKQIETRYNQAKVWQIGFFTLNNTATNLYMFMFNFMVYYATGIAGLLVVTVSTILTAMRIWDGITDPIIGYIIDRTETKFGKFRPAIILGNLIMIITTIILFTTVHRVPEGIRLIYFIVFYAIYIVGYTLQTACSKAAQTVLTNDPEQRPIFTVFNTIYNTALFMGVQLLVSSYLVPKHGGFTLPLFYELITFSIIVGAILTTLAVIGIWSKDVKENFGLGDKGTKVRFRDFWPVIKGNRPLQMLIVAASTDKLGTMMFSNATVGVMLYGILMGNYALSGNMKLITAIPTILIGFFGLHYARKFGQKKAFVGATWLCVIIYAAFFLFFVVTDLTTISLVNFNIATFIFLVFMAVGEGVRNKTGRFVPGMLGTIFSFVDKFVSSFSTSIIGLCVALIGFTEVMPTVGDSATPGIFWVTMFFFIGIPMFGWIASIISMKYYSLDKEKMQEIQEKIESTRLQNA